MLRYGGKASCEKEGKGREGEFNATSEEAGNVSISLTIPHTVPDLIKYVKGLVAIERQSFG